MSVTSVARGEALARFLVEAPDQLLEDRGHNVVVEPGVPNRAVGLHHRRRTQVDVGRGGLLDMALETAPWRRILNADRRGWVLIGECTSDIGVHVHRNAIPMCVPALPYMAGSLAVATRPPERCCRSGAGGR